MVSSINGYVFSASANNVKSGCKLVAGVKVEVKGEMTLSVHNGKPDLSCRVEELSLYVPETDNSNQ